MPTPPPNPDQFKGQTLVSFLTALVGWLARNAPRASPGSGLTVEETSGGSVWTVERRDIGWIKVTSRSGNAHAWNRVIATGTGAWSNDTTLSGTTSDDPAYEANGDVTFTLPQVVYAWRDQEQGEVRFSKSKC